MASVGESHELSFEVFQPRGLFGQMNVAGFNLSCAGIHSNDLVGDRDDSFGGEPLMFEVLKEATPCKLQQSALI